MRILYAILVVLISSNVAAQQALATTYKDPNCGCCTKWIDHIEQAGFLSNAKNSRNMSAVKQHLMVPKDLYSCHSTTINGYVFEGHIPANVVQKFLANPPKDALGLSVPAMPMGSPGMEVAGRKGDDYTVYVFDQKGNYKAYQHIKAK